MQKEEQRDYVERLLRARDVYADRLHLSRSAFYDLVRNGDFPPPVRITAQRVGWRESAVDSWVRSRPEVNRLRGADA